MDAKIFLYVAMILTVCVMIWANLQYKAKGVPWGRPLAGLCGVVSLLLAVSAMLMQVFLPGVSHKKLHEKEQQYQYIAYKFLGQEIAKQHAGKKTLLVRYPIGRSEAAIAMDQAQMDGLKEGLGGKVELIATHLISGMMEGMEPGDGGGMEYDMLEPEPMFTAEEFNKILDNNSDCEVIITLCGLPYDIQQMSYWKKANDGQNVPKLVLVNADVSELRPVIKAGLVSIVLLPSPDRYDWEAPVPRDEGEAFKSRFLMITTENVDDVAAEHSQVFIDVKK